MFHVGDKVVCINDKNQSFKTLVKNDIYTVRCIVNNGKAVYLREITLPFNPFTGAEVGHRADRFRLADWSDLLLADIKEQALQEIKEKKLTL